MEYILTVLGILLPIIISYWQIRKTRIVLYQIEYYNLSTSTYSNFQNLNISFEDYEITKNLNFFKGFVLVTGFTDIARDQIQNAIKLSNGANETKFLDFKQIKGTSGYEVVKGENFIELKSDIIKSKDFIFFETIFESNDQNLNIEYRILNTDRSRNKLSFPFLVTQIKGTRMLLVVLAFLFYLLFTSTFSTFDFKPQYYIKGIEVTKNQIEQNNDQFESGVITGIDQSLKQANSMLGDSLISISTYKAIKINLNYLKAQNEYDAIRKPNYFSIEMQTIDRIVDNKWFLSVLVNRDYKHRFKIDKEKDIEIAFEFDAYFSLFMNLVLVFLIVILLVYIIRYQYMNILYIIPIQKIIKENNIEV